MHRTKYPSPISQLGCWEASWDSCLSHWSWLVLEAVPLPIEPLLGVEYLNLKKAFTS